MEFVFDEIKLSNILKATISTICSNIFSNCHFYTLNGLICIKVDNNHHIVVEFNDVYKISKDNTDMNFVDDKIKSNETATNILMRPRINNTNLRPKFNHYNDYHQKITPSISHIRNINRFMPKSVTKSQNCFKNESFISEPKLNHMHKDSDNTFAIRLNKSISLNTDTNYVSESPQINNKRLPFFSLQNTYNNLKYELKNQENTFVKPNINPNGVPIVKFLNHSNTTFSNSNLKSISIINQQSISQNDTGNAIKMRHLDKDVQNNLDNIQNPLSFSKSNQKKNFKYEIKLIPANETKLVPRFSISNPIKTIVKPSIDEIPKFNFYNRLTPIKINNCIVESNYINNIQNCNSTTFKILPQKSTNIVSSQIQNSTFEINSNILPFEVLRAPLHVSEQNYIQSSLNISEHGYSKFEVENSDDIDSQISFKKYLEDTSIGGLINCKLDPIDCPSLLTNDNLSKNNNDQLVELQKRQISLAKKVLDDELLRQKQLEQDLININGLTTNPITENLKILQNYELYQNKNIALEKTTTQDMNLPILHFRDINTYDDNIISSTITNYDFLNEISLDRCLEESVSLIEKQEHTLNLIKLSSTSTNDAINETNLKLPTLKEMSSNHCDNNLSNFNLRKEKIIDANKFLCDLKTKMLITLEAIYKDNLVSEKYLEETEALLNCLNKKNKIFLKSFHVLPFKSVFAINGHSDHASDDNLSQSGDSDCSDISSHVSNFSDEFSVTNKKYKLITSKNFPFVENKMNCGSSKKKVRTSIAYNKQTNLNKFDAITSSNKMSPNGIYTNISNDNHINGLLGVLDCTIDKRSELTNYPLGDGDHNFIAKSPIDKNSDVKNIVCKFCGKKQKNYIALAQHISNLHHDNLFTFIPEHESKYRKTFASDFIY